MRTLGSAKSRAICGNAVSTAVASISSMNKAQPMIIGIRRRWVATGFSVERVSISVAALLSVWLPMP